MNRIEISISMDVPTHNHQSYGFCRNTHMNHQSYSVPSSISRDAADPRLGLRPQTNNLPQLVSTNLHSSASCTHLLISIHPHKSPPTPLSISYFRPHIPSDVSKMDRSLDEIIAERPVRLSPAHPDHCVSYGGDLNPATSLTGAN